MDQGPTAAFGESFDVLDFGLEIEASISVQKDEDAIAKESKTKKAGAARDKVRLVAAARRILPPLTDAGINCRTSKAIGVEPTAELADHKSWYIDADISTYSPHVPGVCPLEFSSPVWKANEPEWRQELADVENLICSQLGRQPKSFQQCSTQINVSFPEKQWHGTRLGEFPLDKAKLLMLAGFVFEDVIDNLMPMKERPGRFAQRNTKLKDIQKPQDGQLTELTQCWKKMGDVRNLQDLHKMVCWESQYDDRVIRGCIRNYKWNISGSKSIALMWKWVEYRQLPPVTAQGQLVPWANLLLGFIGAATSINPKKLDGAAATGDEREIYKVYGLTKKPTELAEIQRFIGQYVDKFPKCRISKEQLEEVPKIKEQVEKAWATKS